MKGECVVGCLYLAIQPLPLVVSDDKNVSPRKGSVECLRTGLAIKILKIQAYLFCLTSPHLIQKMARVQCHKINFLSKSKETEAGPPALDN